MRPKIITKQLEALDRNGISLAGQRVGAGVLLIDGAYASGGVATLDTQRIVGIYSGGNLAARVFTITGTDGSGAVISETITGPGVGATVSGVLMFKTVTRVYVDGTIASDAEVGTTDVGATQIIPLDQHISPFAIGLFVEIASGATVNVTVQYTPDNVQTLTNINSAALGVAGVIWTPHASLTNKTSNGDSNIAYPATAVRMLVNSGTAAAKFIIRQAGI